MKLSLKTLFTVELHPPKPNFYLYKCCTNYQLFINQRTSTQGTLNNIRQEREYPKLQKNLADCKSRTQ
ncbi:hypothetical protein AQUCO_00700197v1 [Aquilegia coerulea]|uniref:Uncharacterized protein n=1 Tax=Aquilegia coerulea TaxID=218851 RepID=A0A2G5EIY2_AQUCA|nr:hypothetical protein AQUCO_00700197v1 [Aquilegia coerulea]